MIAERIAAGQVDRRILGVEVIGVTADVRAEEESTSVAARRRARRKRIQADFELGEFAPAERGLVALIVAVTDAQLGREGVGPVRVQLENTGIDLFLQLIAVGLQAERERRGGEGVLLKLLRALVVDVGELGAMIVVDVPVELADELVVFLDRVLDQAERVVAVDVLGDRCSPDRSG